MRYFWLFMLLFFQIIPAQSQSETIQTFKDSNLVQLGLFFSPSTLRMINFQNDSAYNEMVKGIKKMKVLILRPDKFTQDHYYDAMDKLVNQEGYEEYIILENNDYELQVLGKPKKQEMVGLAKNAGRFYAFSLQGTIDLMQLPDLYENLSNQDSTSFNGISYVMDMIKKDENNRVHWEERRKKRAKKKRKEDSIRIEEERLDSLKLDTTKTN